MRDDLNELEIHTPAYILRAVACPLCGACELRVFPEIEKLQCGGCYATNTVIPEVEAVFKK